VRFLIDECLTTQLVGVANDFGYQAHHVAHLQMAGAEDWAVARHAWEHDFVLVTNNSDDCLHLYADRELHSGLVIVIPNVRLELQRRLFAAALDHLAEAGEPINQVLEINLEHDEVVLSVYEFPAGDL
jgi:predicted nuclease of predicted toxin-antitoxin system